MVVWDIEIRYIDIQQEEYGMNTYIRLDCFKVAMCNGVVQVVNATSIINADDYRYTDINHLRSYIHGANSYQHQWRMIKQQ